MAQETMNQFKLIRQNGTAITAVCAQMKDAVNRYDTADNPLIQAQRTAVSLEVILPDTPTQVSFRTLIAGAGAEEGGCKATPAAFTVPDGQNVIFEALPAIGYTFVGWWLGTDTTQQPISQAIIASIAINAPLTIAEDVIITAQFAPVTP